MGLFFYGEFMKNIFDLPVHPSADIFPMISDDELQELADDIKANGLIHPVVIKNNVLIDGRNRLAACKLAGITDVLTTELEGDIDSYIIPEIRKSTIKPTFWQKLGETGKKSIPYFIGGAIGAGAALILTH